jgi:hypothetical protein
MSNGNLSLFVDGFQQGEGFGCDLASRGANVELPWTYRGATCKQASWLQEKRMSNGFWSLLFKEKNAFGA